MTCNRFVTPFLFAVSITALALAAMPILDKGKKIEPTAGAAISSSVAFVDFPAIVRESEAGKSLIAQAEEKTKELQEDAKKKLEKLKDQQEAIRKNAKSLSEKELAEKGKDLQSKIDEWNAIANKRQAAINDAVNKNVEAINKTLREELSAIAKEKGFYAILPAENAFYFDGAYNLTADAIRITNDKFPSVELKIEDGEKK